MLAGGAVRLIADTVNALYTTSRPAPIELTAAEAWTGILTGALVAFASALAPAREAMLVAPTEAMSRGAREHRARLRWRRGLAWSAVFAAARIGRIAGRRRIRAIRWADTSPPCWPSRAAAMAAPGGGDRGQSRHPARRPLPRRQACWRGAA